MKQKLRLSLFLMLLLTLLTACSDKATGQNFKMATIPLKLPSLAMVGRNTLLSWSKAAALCL